MILIRKTLAIVICLALLTGCKQKKKTTVTGEKAVDVKEFLGYFKALTLPFQYSDTSLLRSKRELDSALIDGMVFIQFVPDSIFRKVYNKNVHPKIYAIGQVRVPGAETYLFIKTVATERKAVFLLVFDKKQQFVVSATALAPDQNNLTTQLFSLDRRFTFTKSISRRNSDGSISEGKDVFVYNADARNFNLIMTDALEDKATELINPIDTLPKKNRWSGDYTNGKMNLVSVRDGRRTDRITFFVHFEKGKGCSGELKGEALIRSGNYAEYSRDGDPCKLKLIFSASSVTLSEVEGCGSYRPLNCSFNGKFLKKKEKKKIK